MRKKGNYYTPFSLRISEELLAKIKIIAIQNQRSANKEMAYALERYVAAFEEQHGEIQVDADDL